MYVVLLAMEVSPFWIVAGFLSAMLILSKCWNYHNVGQKIPITIRYGRQVLPLGVSSEQTVGDLKKLAAKMFSIPKNMHNAIVFRLRNQILHENTTLLSDIRSNCELQLGLSLNGGTHFDSIPVNNIRPLMKAIKSDFDKWIRDFQPLYKARFLNDPLEGKPVVWDGFSGSIQYFFKINNITPCEKYKQFYSDEERSVSVSYVWSATYIRGMAGTNPNFSSFCKTLCFYELYLCMTKAFLFSDEFDKPEYKKERAFIDVLCVPQNNLPNVFETTKKNYSGCWMVIFVAGFYLTRAWCCLEIAFAMMTGCKITVIGQCNMVKGRTFFEDMVATVPSDIEAIKLAIKQLVGSDDTQTAQLFNNIVSKAMEILFVQAHKDRVCDLSTDRKLGDWGERRKFISPQNLPRDQTKDWAILTGQAREVEEADSRTLRVFLLSTQMDTVLEWSYFLQDCAQYLMECARERGLDLIFSDMRHGSREEEALSLDALTTELECCKAKSADLACLAIIGNKYGFRPVPARIPKEEFDEIVAFMSVENALLCKGAYELDENKLKPEYVLKGGCPELTAALRDAAKSRWPDAVNELRDPTRSVCPILSILHSLPKLRILQLPPHPDLLCVGRRAARVHQHLGWRTGPRDSAEFSRR